jgi:hypothetical protein
MSPQMALCKQTCLPRPDSRQRNTHDSKNGFALLEVQTG